MTKQADAKPATGIPTFQEFPKWKYKGAKGVIVNSADEEAALGEGYADAPTEEASAAGADPKDARIAELEAQLLAAQGSKKAGKQS